MATNSTAATKNEFLPADDLKSSERVGGRVIYFLIAMKEKPASAHKSRSKAQSDKTNEKFWEKSRENVASVEAAGINVSAKTKPAISKTFVWWIC